MNNSFRIGDLVILQHPTYYHENDGCPAVITGGHAPRQATDMCSMKQVMAWTWEVRLLKQPDCLDSKSPTVLVRTHQMRKPGADEDQRFRRARRDREVTSC